MNKIKAVYDLTEFPANAVKVTADNPKPEGLKHSFGSIPKIGDAVYVTMNQLGPGIVEGFFVEYDYVGVIVRLNPATDPAWHKKQVKGTWHEGKALVFGAEVAL